jgi:lipoate-protein ligase A
MQLIKTTFDDVTDLITELLQNQEEACVYCISDECAAIVGRNAEANINLATKEHVRLIRINHEGGTIVTSPGDIQIGIFTKGYSGNFYRDKILEDIIMLLKTNGYTAAIVKNDVLVDGKKVIGFGSRMYGNLLYTAIQISININIDLIRQICTKHMEKSPDGLQNYGITTQDVLDILAKVINTHEEC